MRQAAAMDSRQPGGIRPELPFGELPGGIDTPGLDFDLGPLPARTIHVWAIPVDGRDEPGMHNACLSAAEQRRAQGFISARDRHRFIARRVALRQLLGRYLKLQPGAIRIDEGSGRKPAIGRSGAKHERAGDLPDIGFNCSHSDGLALFAFSRDMPVDIDLERVRPMPDANEVARRFFSLHETRALMKIPAQDRLAAFYRCWTAKEALVKALGHGLAMPLDAFTVSVAPGQAAQLLHLDTGDPGDWSLTRLRPSPGFSATLAVRAGGPVSIVTSWS